MGRKTKKESKEVKVGEFVFAKVRGFRAWPARVLQEEARQMYSVYFYGTCNISKVGTNLIYEYEKFKSRLGIVKRCGLFKEAMEHVEHAMANPVEDHGYFKAKAEMAGDDQDDLEDPEDLVDEANDSSSSSEDSLLYNTFQLPFIHITGDSD